MRRAAAAAVNAATKTWTGAPPYSAVGPQIYELDFRLANSHQPSGSLLRARSSSVPARHERVWKGSHDCRKLP